MDWTFTEGQVWDTVGADTSTTQATSIPDSNTAHVKGSWTELTSSLPRTCAGFWLNFVNNVAGDDQTMLDIGVGASGSEQVILANAYIKSNGADIGEYVYIPLTIPAGTRIAARCQTRQALSSSDPWCEIIFEAKGFLCDQGLSTSETFGATTSNTTGVVIDTGATPHVKGAWVQLTSGLARDARALVLCVAMDMDNSTLTTRWLIDIAVGASGSEQIILANILFSLDGSGVGLMRPGFYGPIPVEIKAGTRIAARGQATATISQTQRSFQVVGIAFA